MYRARDGKSACLAAVIAAGFVLNAAAQSTAPAAPTNKSPTAAQTPAAQGAQTASPATVPPAMASGAASKAADLSAGDKKFMQTAAQDGMAEVQMAQLAAQKAAEPQVKQFAERMIADHSKANDKLKRIASSKNVQLPGDIPTAERRMHDKLSKMSGAEFDREYMKHMVGDHKKATTEFRNAAKTLRDPELKQFAADTLPTLEEHLKLAQTTASKTTAAAKNASSKKG